MHDTSPEIAERVREMFQAKSPIERLKMGFSMHETSKYLVARAIGEDALIYSAADMRKELFLRFYGNDFDTVARQEILDYLGPSPTRKEAPEKDQYQFEHIPKAEKGQEWWTRLFPLIKARLLRESHENSKLLRALSSINGLCTWKDIKNSIETTLTIVKGGERILARISEIKNAPDPDDIIDDMVGELRTVPYLLMKGFKNITYFRREGLDFKAEFGGNVFHIESTYVHGPDFKTQEYIFTTKQQTISPVYKIRPDKLIRLFERTYAKKKEQVMRNQGTAGNTLIIMITDLEETYAPWLEHASIQGLHPILKLILEWEIPTVIFGRGSVYEPQPESLGGVFGALHAFDWPIPIR